MPTTDTPPAAPTADGLRAALALIDDFANGQPKRLNDRGLRVEDVTAAVFAVARADIAHVAATEARMAAVRRNPFIGHVELAPLSRASVAAADALGAARAALVALAVGGAS